MKNDPQHLSYYKRLGITEDASVEEVETAYKDLRKQFHPDTKPSVYRDYFDHSMKGINEAYDILSDPDKRHRYDLRLFKERKYKDKTQYPDVSHENYEIGLTSLSHRVDALKGFPQTYRDYLAEMEGYREEALAALTTFLDSGEAQQDPHTKLKIIEDYEQLIQQLGEGEESVRISKLADTQEIQENIDSLLEKILYLEDHLSNPPTERRIELQSMYERLMREIYALLKHQPQ